MFDGGKGCGEKWGEEEEQLSASRLLADDYDINFYICQLHMMR